MASATYYLRNTASDLSGGADFNYKLLTTTTTAATLLVNIASGATEDSYAFTDPGVPTGWGDISSVTVEINVTGANSNIQLSAAVSRVNASGTAQASSSFAAEQSGGTTGVKTFTVPSPGLGAWNSGDRLRVSYRFRETTAMAAGSITIGQNTANEEVIVTYDLPISGGILMMF